ncbi:MAG: BNR-4 repeat-containing protein [Planctomycetales bacterium]|nr:BNR-4 repeat-containing protein [Planctomycetales bacterium]
MFHIRLKTWILAAVGSCLALAALESPTQGQTTYATPANGFSGIWYENEPLNGDYANKYGGGLATYPQQINPMAIYSASQNKTYFSFSYDLDPGPGLNIGHAISYYDHQTNQVARPQIWIDKQTSDAHDAATLALDNDGYIYMFSMNHGEARQAYISKSANPYDISSFTSLLSPTSTTDMAVFGNPSETPGNSGNPRFSYASPWYVPNAEEADKFLLLHTRYTDNNGDRDLFTTTSVDGDTWTPRKTFAQIEDGQYQTSWIKPDGASVGTIFNVHPSGQGLNARTDLYYMQTSDQARTWQTVDGLTLIDNQGANNTPFSSRPEGPGTGAAQVYNAAPGERVYLKDVNYDAAGNPVILFLTSPTAYPGDYGDPGPDRFVRTAHWNGSRWVVRSVTVTDNNYDHGSLYVESDGTWRIIAPFLDGPQQYATGGEMGMWTSSNQGQSWSVQTITSGSYVNHTYARRPLNAQDDFYAFWADGDGWEPSAVNLLFANKSGEVFQLPSHMTGDFATPVLFTPQPPSPLPSIEISLVGVDGTDGTIASVTVTQGTARTYALGELIPAQLTAFGGQTGTPIADIITPQGTATAPAPNLRAGLLGDGRVDTGFVNLSSWSVEFDESILNRPGPDLFMLDWGSAESVTIAINGNEIQGVNPFETVMLEQDMSARPRFRSNETDVDTLSELVAATFYKFQTTASDHVNAVAIDLSDFGFAEGEFLLAGMGIEFSNGGTIDPLEVFGLPIPGDLLRDGVVNGRDFLLWQRNLAGPIQFADWQTYFGEHALAIPTQHSVPEPKTMMLTALGVLAMRLFGVGSAFSNTSP